MAHTWLRRLSSSPNACKVPAKLSLRVPEILQSGIRFMQDGPLQRRETAGLEIKGMSEQSTRSTAVGAPWWIRKRWRLGLAIAWAVSVCYPNPGVLVRSIQNAWRPVIDAESVREWALTLPANPRQIEASVLERITYAVPWETDGVPWTFPTPAEVMARNAGDCQGRAVVLASVFEARGMPYRLEASFDHIWVDYPGRKGTGIENPNKVMVRRAPTADGWASRMRLPEIDWAESWRIEREYFWDTAPWFRRTLIVFGWFVLALIPIVRRRARSIGTHVTASHHDDASANQAR